MSVDNTYMGRNRKQTEFELYRFYLRIVRMREGSGIGFREKGNVKYRISSRHVGSGRVTGLTL